MDDDRAPAAERGPSHASDPADHAPLRPELVAALAAAVLFAVAWSAVGPGLAAAGGLTAYLALSRRFGSGGTMTGPRVPPRLVSAAFGIGLVLAGLVILAIACFISLFTASPADSFLGPTSTGERIYRLVLGLGGAAIAGAMIAAGASQLLRGVRGSGLGPNVAVRAAAVTVCLSLVCMLAGADTG